MDYRSLNYINFSQKELEDFFSEAKSGNSKSFEVLSGYVRNISYSYFQSKQRQGKIINNEDIDDLTNNVYLSFAEQYHKIENLEFWLRRVLFLNFVNWYKKSKAKKTFELDESYYLESSTSHPGDKVDAEKIISAIENLSEDKQRIIKMRFWEELKFAEIAEQLDKSEDAVKKMFYRSIEELKGKF